jgi:aconitate decarboxylase
MPTGPTPLTQALAGFVAEPRIGRSLPAAIRIAKIGLIDTVATAMAGCREPAVRIVLEHLAAQGSTPEAPLLFSGTRMSSAHAAFVNAVAGHALDYDDVSLSAHTSTVLIPALLAEGHRLGASGHDVLRAYAVGYEVWADLHTREPDPLHLKGWHPTSVFGTVAAAAAVAHLAKLPAPTVQTALAIAASLSSGLVANFGTMTKPLHAGRAASHAIEAVRLAERGLTAAPDAIEHRAGFLAALSPTSQVDLARPFAVDPDRLRLESIGLSVKQYPVCYSCHRVIDGAIALIERHDLSPADVASVQVRIGAAQASMLRNPRPVTGLEARFSIEFAVAAALVARRVGLAELSDAFVTQPAVQAQFAKVKVDICDRLSEDSAFGYADRVRITCTDGREFDSGDIRFARGSARNPLDPDELRQKFLDCMAYGGSARDATPLYARLSAFEDLDDVRSLFG